VVSNPPYFRNALKPPVDSRAMARHDDRLGYESLLQGSGEMLVPEGKLAVIIPANETMRFTELAYFKELYPCRLTWVRPDPLKKYSRCLMEFTVNRQLACSTDELTIREVNNAAYTDEYMALTKEFYLKF
jgi:tRNA1Val (adenine37-N6)-methyltransferase